MAEPPLAASEALPHKRRRRPGPRFPRTRVAYRLRGRYWDRTSDLFRVREARYHCANRPNNDTPCSREFEVETGFEPVYTDLQAVASPLGHSTSEKAGPPNPLRADDRVRTGDLNLGKVALYQLSYVRIATAVRLPRREKNISPSRPEFKNRGPLSRRRTVIVRSPSDRPATRIACALRCSAEGAAHAHLAQRRLAGDEATVSPLDHGLTTGDGVFETIKIVDGRPFAVTRHLERLVRSAVGLGLPDPDVAQLEEGVAAIVKADPDIPFGRLRITYTGGVSPLSSDRGTSGPTILIATQAIKRPGPTSAIVTVPWVRNERSAVAGLKTTSYAENVRALAYAKERGGSEAIFANTIGNLCEGTGLEHLLRVRRRARHADAAVGGAGRRDPRAGARVVRRSGARCTAREPARRRGGLPHLHHARRPSDPSRRQPRPPGARRHHRPGHQDLHRTLSREPQPLMDALSG